MADWVFDMTISPKEKTEFKPVKLCLKIELVSHPSHGRGVGYIHPESTLGLFFAEVSLRIMVSKYIQCKNIFSLSF